MQRLLSLALSVSALSIAFSLPAQAQPVQISIEPEPEKTQIQCGHKNGVEICLIRQTKKGKRITTVVRTAMPGYPDRPFCDIADSRCATSATRQFQSYLVSPIEQATRCTAIDTDRNCRIAQIPGLQTPPPQRIDRKNR
jgi:hypothetical protein